MNEITYSNSIIASILNDKFYAVDFNAAYQKEITVNDRTYKSTGKNNPHELATVLLKNQFVFPSNVFLNEKFEIITTVPGYNSSKQIEPILNYFESRSYETVKYQDFLNSFKPEIK